MVLVFAFDGQELLRLISWDNEPLLIWIGWMFLADRVPSDAASGTPRPQHFHRCDPKSTQVWISSG